MHVASSCAGPLLAAALTTAACAPPPVVEVQLRGTSFATSHADASSCATAGPPPDAQRIASNEVGCDPKSGSNGYSAEVVIAQQELACGDGRGALVVARCAGAGVDGNVSGTVKLAITSRCGTNIADSGDGDVLTFDKLAPGQSAAAFLSSCSSFNGACASSDPCSSNAFDAEVVVTNTTKPQ